MKKKMIKSNDSWKSGRRTSLELFFLSPLLSTYLARREFIAINSINQRPLLRVKSSILSKYLFLPLYELNQNRKRRRKDRKVIMALLRSVETINQYKLGVFGI